VIVTDQSETFARPRIAAGALFLDAAGRVLLVKPTYKDHWDIPGGYATVGESPRAACTREIREELGLTIEPGPLLVVDWAPAEGEGDKILYIFGGAPLGEDELASITLDGDELSTWEFVVADAVAERTPIRLSRRIATAAAASQNGRTTYAEHGVDPAPAGRASI
jgi:ADP-ribose pyrophosphatase YjhB (NUDIX family)